MTMKKPDPRQGASPAPGMSNEGRSTKADSTHVTLSAATIDTGQHLHPS